MMRNVILLLLFFGLICKDAVADFFIDDNCVNAYSNIICLRIDDGKKYIELEKKQHPSNDVTILLDNYIDFLTVFITDDRENFDRLKKNKNLRLEQIERGDPKSPFYLYALAEINLQWAFARIKFKEYMSAAFEIQKANKLLTRNAELYPFFKANLKSLGFLHAIAGSVPENFKWITKIVGMKGSIAQGMDELHQLLTVSESGDYKYLHNEVVLLLTFLNLNVVKDENEAKKLIETFSDETIRENPFICYSVASVYMKTGMNDQAISTLDESPSGNEYLSFPYLDYLRGVMRMNKLDSGAVFYFNRFLNSTSGQNDVRAAYQKIAWLELIQGNQQQYRENIRNCIDNGDDFTDEDKQALNEAKSGEIPNVPLLRARLLFDGGYYSLALSEIGSKTFRDFPRLRDQLELTYRLARIFHKNGNIDKAIEYYEQTYKNGSSFRWYFAANSALQLGLIYESRGDFGKAKEYYENVTALRDHEYQNSIDQKAEAGLDRISEK